MSPSQPLCLVFEHQPNGTLRDLLDNSSKQITTKMIVKWVRDISAGMLHLVNILYFIEISHHLLSISILTSMPKELFIMTWLQEISFLT